MAKHAGGKKKAKKKGRAGRVVAVIFAILFVGLIAACVVVVVVRPPVVIDMLEGHGIYVPKIGIEGTSVTVERPSTESPDPSDVSDVIPTKEEAVVLEEQSRRAQKTPLLARCGDVDLRCAVNMLDVTGIMFHQASYDYALPLETELPQADYETVANNRTMRVNHDQKAGENDWADAEVLHLWRTTDATDMDTSIDLGAKPGTTIVSPVSGTVTLVRDYMLYDEMPDVEIHIQPEGRPDLDRVLIHTTDPAVKAGDNVQAGLTPIAKVRSIEDYLTDVQLGFFLPEGTGGNHTHIQMNNADYPGYREKRLAGAVATT